MYKIVSPLVRLASADGYAISVLFLGEGPLQAFLEREGVPTAVVPFNGRKTDVAGILRLTNWLRAHSFDVAHLHHGGYVVRELCRLSGAKAVIQHVHGEANESDLSSIAGDRIRGSDAVIACSQSAMEKLRQSNPELIYAGIETPTVGPAPPPDDGPLRLGTLARLVPLKRLDMLIAATANLVTKGIDVSTEICGDGPSEASLRALTERLEMSEKVQFVGWQEDAAARLASWHAFVLPSATEGLPISVLEAMAAGRAVVASRVGGLEELVEDGVTGRLFPVGDTDSLAACLEALNRDRAQLASMGREGYCRAQTQFSASKMARSITNLYDRLLAK